ncbi:acetyltransferase NSI [Salix suchowensis]|nr:acetyltransferase NSI [Salix suchowensis]
MLTLNVVALPSILPIFSAQPCNHQFNYLLANTGRRKLKVTRPRANFWDSIRSGFLKDNSTQVVESPSTLQDEEEPQPEEFVLVEKTEEDGVVEQIIFSSGGDVDIYDLQTLCDKVTVADYGNDDASYRNRCFIVMLGNILVAEEERMSSSSGKDLVRHLLKSLLEALLQRDIGNITLFADSQVVEFYQNFGIEPDPEGIKGMFWYPKY